MDNITHSLAGLLFAGAATQWRTRALRADPDEGSFATVAAITGVIGANLPDIDVFWGAALQRAGVYDSLLTLLHHRGFTHTVLAALVFMPLLYMLASAFRAWQLRDTITSSRERRADRTALLALCIIAVASHVTLDFTNDYGVHPFSPFVNTWVYGDTVFIIEPWLWIVAIPMVVRVSERRAVRGALWLVLLAGLALCWVAPQVAREAAAVATVGAAIWIFVSSRVRRRSAPLVGILAWCVVTALFVAGTRVIRAQVVAAQQALAPTDAAHLVDLVSSPSPANPLCARIITVETTREVYRLTTAWGSALPQVVSAARCSEMAHTDTTHGALTLPMDRTTRVDTPAVDWQWTWQAARVDLAQLVRSNCRVAAWLRFVRVPFWVARGADSLRVGDLRYDRERVSVAAFTFPVTPSSCPAGVPPWARPRQGVVLPDGAD